jgi:hypothetical protein
MTRADLSDLLLGHSPDYVSNQKSVLSAVQVSPRNQNSLNNPVQSASVTPTGVTPSNN